MALAPIVLFTYNRPEHTRKTLEALRANELASASTLYIYCDGPTTTATATQKGRIEATRSVAKEQQWCANVSIIESETNLGLASSILQGVSTIIKKHGKIIVLEDDIVTHPLFLRYMNTALDVYERHKEVYHINGFTNESAMQFLVPDFYFLHFMSCWGWATWDDRWSKLQSDHTYYYERLINNPSLLSKFNYNHTIAFHNQLADNISGKINTWAILWYSTVFFNDGLCLTAKNSFVINIGLDGSGEHCGIEEVPDQFKTKNQIDFKQKFEQLEVQENWLSRKHLELYFKFGNQIKIGDVFKRIRNKVKKVTRR